MVQHGPPMLLWSFGVTKEGKMKKIGTIFVRAGNWLLEKIFELLIKLSGEDDDDDWRNISPKVTHRPLCGNEATDPSPPKGN